MEGSNRIFIVLLLFSKNEGKEYFMKISEIKIEALKLMFVGGSQVLLPENLYIYKNDESFGFYLVRMNGAINRCFSRLEAMGVLPGLRLVPYHSVGKSSFLLAIRLQNVKIGSWQGSSLVAFAPEGLSKEGAYQALTGGNV